MARRKNKKNKMSKMKSSASPVSTIRTQEKVGTNFQLEIPDMVFQKIMWWIHKSSHEVSGFGHLDFDEETRTFTVRDAILLKQDVAPTSTEIDPVALGKALYETREEKNALKWHWHSHVDMGVFWSGDDRELIRSLAHQGWIVASVFNKKEEIKTAFSQVVRVMGNEHEMFVDDIPTSILTDLPEDLKQQWDAEYESKVSTPKWERPAVVHNPNAWRQDSFWQRQEHEAQEMKKKETTGSLSTLDLSEFMGIENKMRDETLGIDVTFDGYGLARHPHLGLIYNPIWDMTIEKVDEVVDAIDQMDHADIEWCMKNDPEFNEIHRVYMARKAGQNAGEHSTSPDKATRDYSY